jgi:hydrogenase nickel incorporation protein HypB
MTEITVRERVLAANETAAAALRVRFHSTRTLAINLISSPGSGKTTLLEATIARLAPGIRLGAIDGDIATERDAERLRRLGIPAHQILTGGACHLDARLVQAAMDRGTLDRAEILFIENVGNLICPTSYDLGEDFKVVLLSVTEGDDKPFKYPAIFARAAVCVISKMDLLPHVDFDLETVARQVGTLRPGGRILRVSARTGEGMDGWCGLLRDEWARKRSRD